MKSGLQEIIESGRAPGLRIGNAVDPDSVYAKAPKAFKEIERGEGRSKRPIGAREISRYFGMPTDFIKRKWTETNPKAFACILIFLSSIFTAAAGQLTAGETLQDGQLVHASDLMNLVQNATINPVFISGQPIDNSPLYSDWMIIYSPTLGGTFQKVQLNYIFNNLQGYTLLPSGTPVYTNQDLFSFYSASGTNVESITFSNLVGKIASSILVPSLFDYAYINLPPTNAPTVINPQLWDLLWLAHTTNSTQTNYTGTTISLNTIFQYGYTNVSFSNAPSLTLPLDDDIILVNHDTNQPGSHTNYTGTQISLVGLITNLNPVAFPVFPINTVSSNQYSTNSLALLTNTVLFGYTPAGTNNFLAPGNGTNTIEGTNGSIVQVSVGNLVNLLNEVKKSKKFVSTNISFSGNSLLTIPHGLGVQPSVKYVLICVTNDATSGYSAGPKEYELPATVNVGTTHGSPFFLEWADPTNVYIMTESSSFTIYDLGGPLNLNNISSISNFRVKVYAEP